MTNNVLKQTLINLGLVDESFPIYWAHGYAAILRANGYQYDEKKCNWDYGPHRWWTYVTNAYNLHPIVDRLVREYHVRPANWHLMLLEWPHISEDDQAMIAYTRTEEAGASFPDYGSKRLTKTSVGKYIARHYPHVPAHIQRDLCSLFTPEVFEIWNTKQGIIAGIELGPQSCMKSSYGTIPFRSDDNAALVAWWQGDKDQEVEWNKHPYAVYSPEYGWAMAVRIDKGQPDEVLGRALVYEHGGSKCFVRTYARGNSYSETDTALQAWLCSQGYTKRSGWPEGAKLLHIEHPHRGGPLLPYIDGDIQRVDERSDGFRISDGGEYDCTNTDGTADTEEHLGSCEDCGATVYEGSDYIHVGPHQDTLIGACCSNSYRYVEGSVRGRTREYYVHEDSAIRVSGNYYDEDNLPDSIVYSDYESKHYERDDVVWVDSENDYYECGCSEIVEINGDYYRKDNDDVVQCHDDVYRLKSDCWESAQGNWYSDDETQVDVSEGTYHPDELQELIDNA